MDGSASPFRAPVLALDGPDKVTGAARYTFDVILPGMLHAKVLRSPHPHARVRSIKTSRAEALPGVAAVVTGADAARLPDPYYGVAIRDQPVVAIDKVRYVGDMIAAVAASDEETAYRALSLINVQYEKLQAVPTIDEALAEGAPLLAAPMPRRWRRACLFMNRCRQVNWRIMPKGLRRRLSPACPL